RLARRPLRSGRNAAPPARSSQPARPRCRWRLRPAQIRKRSRARRLPLRALPPPHLAASRRPQTQTPPTPEVTPLMEERTPEWLMQRSAQFAKSDLRNADEWLEKDGLLFCIDNLKSAFGWSIEFWLYANGHTPDNSNGWHSQLSQFA